MKKQANQYFISRIFHAGYIFCYNQKIILFDPVFQNPFSYNCYVYPEIQIDIEKIKTFKVDAIFISHIHDDHLCLKSLNLFDKNIPIYLYAEQDIYFSMLKKIGFVNIYKLIVEKSVEICENFFVKPCLALEKDIDTFFHIQIEQSHILNMVDAWPSEIALEKLKNTNWDLVMWPFQIMREVEVLSPDRFSKKTEIPYEWLDYFKILRPKYIIPSSCQFRFESWSWYNQAFFSFSYKDFENFINLNFPDTQFLRLDPGKKIQYINNKFQFVQNEEIIKLKNQDIVDYVYDENHAPQKISDIAEKLGLPDKNEIDFVLNFCKFELLEAIKAPYFLDEYFYEGTVWRLVLYISKDIKYEFNYKIKDNHVQILSNESVDLFNVDWLTEIPLKKFYSALTLGETLVSIYLRINGIVFSEKTEKNLQKVDLLEDPLINILFNQNGQRFHSQQLIELGYDKK